MGCGPSQGGLGLAVVPRGGSPEHHIPRDRDGRRFGAGLCPFHSPLLRASRLFSFPPLINMLKFGGSPCLLSGRKVYFRVSGPFQKERGPEGVQRNQTMKKKVSNRGVSRGEKVQKPFVSQRVKPTKKEATFLNFSKSQVLGQTNLGATPRRFAGRKKSPMPHTSERKDG
jgi:hypothetical protein